MSCWSKLPTFAAKKGDLHVVIETPKGSRNKYDYDPKLRVLKVNTILPVGMVFPFDFGFIPSTLGDDGDPLDVLVIMEEPAPSGCLVPSRILGVIEAEQTEDGKTERNDRIVVVSSESHAHHNLKTIHDLHKDTVDAVERFFIAYNDMHGKQFKAVGVKGPNGALKLIKAGQDQFQKKQGDELKGKSKKKKKSPSKS